MSLFDEQLAKNLSDLQGTSLVKVFQHRSDKHLRRYFIDQSRSYNRRNTSALVKPSTLGELLSFRLFQILAGKVLMQFLTTT